MQDMQLIFKGVFSIAKEPLDILGYQIAPLDMWLTVAVMYMIIDLILWLIGWGDDGA